MPLPTESQAELSAIMDDALEALVQARAAVLSQELPWTLAATLAQMTPLGVLTQAYLNQVSKPVMEAYRIAGVAYDTLLEVKPWVLGDGGPHGSPARAWAAWTDLAQTVIANLERAMEYSESATLRSLLSRGSSVLGEASQTVTRMVQALVIGGAVIGGVVLLTNVLQATAAVRAR